MRRKDILALNKVLRVYFKKHGRAHLPWRSTRDPYRILVSEVMLQQTQVERVIPFYKKFLKAFPDTKTLARAPLPQILALWHGLGYNRRAQMLRGAAVVIEKEFHGVFPHRVEDIERLPGVGAYTARAIAVFTFNQSEICIETNIRSVFLRHFFARRRGKISDSEILPLVAETLRASRMQPREFYAALMDYGAFLKKSGVRNNVKSKHYAKQSKFEGSRRQLRGQILKLLLQKPHSAASLRYQTKRTPQEVREELARLQKEKFIIKKGQQFSISE